MRSIIRTVAVTLALVAAAAVSRANGQQFDAKGNIAEKPIIPVKVQLVISRYQGEKKVSSLPYTLVVNANGPKAQLRMGSSVPITSMTIPSGRGDAPATSYQYRDVGINIDCTAASADDGRFRIDLSVEDSSVYGDEASTKNTVAGAPSFRSFRILQIVTLKDGQSRELVAATDKVNGEVTKVEVTLTVVK